MYTAVNNTAELSSDIICLCLANSSDLLFDAYQIIYHDVFSFDFLCTCSYSFIVLARGVARHFICGDSFAAMEAVNGLCRTLKVDLFCLQIDDFLLLRVASRHFALVTLLVSPERLR